VNPGISRPVHVGHDLPGMRQMPSLPCPGLCLLSICQSGWQRMRGGSRITPKAEGLARIARSDPLDADSRSSESSGPSAHRAQRHFRCFGLRCRFCSLGFCKRCSTGRPEAWKAVSNFPQFSFFGGPVEGAVAWRRCCRCNASQSTPPAPPDGVEGQV
jgi:hypothetical protein